VLTNKHPHLVLLTGKESRLSKALVFTDVSEEPAACPTYLQAVDRQTNQRCLNEKRAAVADFFIYSIVPVDVITKACLLTAI
jgi:hypothetical protein